MNTDRIISKLNELRNVINEETGEDNAIQKIGLTHGFYDQFMVSMYEDRSYIGSPNKPHKSTFTPSSLNTLKILGIEFKVSEQDKF